MPAKVTLEMGVRDFKKLADYLEHHEDDIARSKDDFGDLLELYILVFEDNPFTKTPPKSKRSTTDDKE